MVFHRVDLVIEAKEDETIEGVAPRIPEPDGAALRLQDVLADLTKHDATFGWRITEVHPVAAGTALVSAADLSHLLDWVDEHGRSVGPYAETAAALRRDLVASTGPGA